MSDRPRLALVAQAQEFFHSLVTDGLKKEKISTRPETEFYLVNLLSQFMTTDRLYAKSKTDDKSNKKDEPLVMMLKEALERPQIDEQRALFRHIGDFSLYTAGFFQDSLNRKLVDVEYYIAMGGSAYQHVAQRVDENANRSIYQELAEKFSAFVEVLARVSDQTSQRSEKDILRLYEMWVRTGSERAAKALHEAGIIPNSTIKKDWQ